MHHIDHSSELCLTPYLHGVQLSKPKTEVEFSLRSLRTLYDLNFSFSLQDYMHRKIFVNEIGLHTYGVSTQTDVYLKTIAAFFDDKNAQQILNDDTALLLHKKMKILSESFVRQSDGLKHETLTFKLPWYADQKIVGVCKLVVILKAHENLTEALQAIYALGLFKNIPKPIQQVENNAKRSSIKFSMREEQCVALLQKGYTCNMIADRLSLSSRTIDAYIANIKNKINVRSKKELLLWFENL